MKNISKCDKYYFNQHEIEIIKMMPSFNLALVKRIDQIDKFVVDTNFLSTHPINENIITITV